MTNKGFDIPSSRFDFAKDLEYGLRGEEFVSSFLEQVSHGDFEVKSDRYRNGRMVIETNQNPKAAKGEDGHPVWVTSGINVTTASWWVYIFSPAGAFVVVSVSRLKKYLRLNAELFNESTKRSLGGADNPARGFLLYPGHVQDMMTNSAYDID